MYTQNICECHELLYSCEYPFAIDIDYLERLDKKSMLRKFLWKLYKTICEDAYATICILHPSLRMLVQSDIFVHVYSSIVTTMAETTMDYMIEQLLSKRVLYTHYQLTMS